MAEYRHIYDEAFSVEAVRRLYASASNKKWPNTATIISGTVVMFGVVIGLAIEKGDWWMVKLLVGLAGLLAGIGFFILVTRHLMFAEVRKDFRESTLKNTEVTVTLTLDGIHLVTADSNEEHTWNIFCKARRFNDGFLLFIASKRGYWLPDVALIEGSMAEIETLIKLNVGDYKVIEK